MSSFTRRLNKDISTSPPTIKEPEASKENNRISTRQLIENTRSKLAENSQSPISMTPETKHTKTEVVTVPKRVANRWEDRRRSEPKKPTPKYGGYGGFGLSFGTSYTKPKSSSSTTGDSGSSPEPSRTPTPSSNLATVKSPESRTPTPKETSRSPDPPPQTADSSFTPSQAREGPRRVSQNQASTKPLPQLDGGGFDLGSTFTSGSLQRGRKSDAGVRYRSSESKESEANQKNTEKVEEDNRRKLEREKAREEREKQKKEEERERACKEREREREKERREKEELEKINLSRGNNRIHSSNDVRTASDARQEKQILQDELDKQDVVRRRKPGTGGRGRNPLSGDHTIEMFYRRRSKLIDTDEISDSKSTSSSPGPSQVEIASSPSVIQRTTPSRSPIPEDSPTPLSPSTESSGTSSISPSPSPFERHTKEHFPTQTQSRNSQISPTPSPRPSPRPSPCPSPQPLLSVLTKTEHSLNQEINRERIPSVQFAASIEKPSEPSSHSPSTISSTSPLSSPARVPSPKPHVTWQPEPQTVPSVEPCKAPAHPPGASSRIISQTKKMMALMSDKEAVIEDHKVEVKKIQKKVEEEVSLSLCSYQRMLCIG